MSTSRVKSAERTIDVLELLAGARRPLPTMVVARQCGMPKSSTHHLLNVLRDRGWATYHAEQRGWTLGPAAHALAHPEGPRERLRWLATPVLEGLAGATGFTAQLVVLDGGEALFLERRFPRGRPPELLSAPGVRVPAYRTAAGRALLMGVGALRLHALYGSGTLVVSATGETRTVNALAGELAAARSWGVVTWVGGLTPGVRCLAVPVPCPARDATPAAALAISMPSPSQSPDREPGLLRALQQAVETLTTTLTPPPRPALGTLRAA
jgi:DNA-binding IclR family transcriptional regulator